MYTASIFMSLISLLYSNIKKEKDIANQNIGFISYGSGSKSKIFEGKICKNWKSKISHLNIFENLDNRKVIDFNTYEKLHNGSIDKPIYIDKNIVLDKIDNRENKVGFRHYKRN